MADYTALSPRHCLTQMADALSNMQAAQAKFAFIQRQIADSDMGPATMDDLRLAQGDTGYYAMLAQTWAGAATALLAALERYGPVDLDDADLRDAKPVVRTPVGAGWAINRQDKRRWPEWPE